MNLVASDNLFSISVAFVLIAGLVDRLVISGILYLTYYKFVSFILRSAFEYPPSMVRYLFVDIRNMFFKTLLDRIILSFSL